MAAESGESRIIDEEGRLFGLINVVDALVVLVVLAIATAGIALVAFPGGDADTRYATIDAGTQPDHIAGQITPGDTWDAGGDELTVTEVYRYVPGDDAAGDGDVGVLIGAEINGTTLETGTAEQARPIEFAGEPLRFGRLLEIATNEYVIEGEVVDVSSGETTLGTESQPLVVQTEVDTTTAGTIQPGDAFTVGTEPVVTVESVTRYATGDPDVRRVVLGVTAETRTVGETPVFGDRPLRTGETLPFRTNDYDFDATIVRQGSLEELGTPATRTVTVQFDRIAPTQADAVAEGMTEAVGDDETAVVLSKEDQPAEVLSETSEGFVTREHPRDRDMQLTLELTVRELDDGSIRFRGEPLRIGADLAVELGGTTLEGEIRAIET